MKTLKIALAGLLLVSLGACTTPARQPMTMTTPAATGDASAQPQTANSLPRGDMVNSPRAAATGNLGTTMVR